MTRRTLALAFAVAGLSIAAPAFAQWTPPADPFGDATIVRKDAEAEAARKFDALDTNHDGILSPDELAAGRPKRPGGDAAREHRGSGERMRGMMGRMMDANADGKITRDEYVAAQLRRFDRMDANHDGQLTSAERKAAIEAMRQRMMERMAGMNGGGMGGDGGPPAGD